MYIHMLALSKGAVTVQVPSQKGLWKTAHQVTALPGPALKANQQCTVGQPWPFLKVSGGAYWVAKMLLMA